MFSEVDAEFPVLEDHGNRLPGHHAFFLRGLVRAINRAKALKQTVSGGQERDKKVLSDGRGDRSASGRRLPDQRRGKEGLRARRRVLDTPRAEGAPL